MTFQIQGAPELLTLEEPKPAVISYSGVQRVFDVTAAVLLLVMLAPFMALIALVIFATDGGHPLYGHVRVGRDGRTFRCWKFRSMVVNGDEVLRTRLAASEPARAEWEATQKLKDDPRVTPIGRFLRTSSFDELPQLFNVLLGEMSLVGPRPIVLSEVGRYRGAFARYCLVRPGITGLWQVSGRNDTSYEQRVAFDMEYVRTQSLLGDLRILVRTVPAVVGRRGSY